MIHMKKMAAAVALAAASICGAQATTLSAGDIQFTGMARESAYGGWSFVTWVDLDIGTNIYFSDNGLNSSGAFKSSVQKENTWLWTATGSIAAGTQVVVYGGTFDLTLGTLSGGVSGQGGTNVSAGSLAAQATADAKTYSFDFSSSGEALYAYQGTTTSPSFVAAITSFTSTPASTSDNPGSSNLGSLIQNLNLVDTTIDRTNWYKGPTTGLTVGQYKAAVADLSNWSTDSATTNFKSLALLEGAGQAGVLAGPAVGVGASNFAIAAVPEANSYAMLLAGLGMIGFMARRRSA